MNNGGGPLGSELPGEVERASYRGREVVLTDRRVVYTGQGRKRHQSKSVHLRDISAVGIGRKRTFRPEWLFLPLGIIVFGMMGSYTIEHEGPFVFSMFMALGSLPFVWMGGTGLAMQIATPGDRLEVRIPRRHRAEAVSFLHHIELARDPGAKREEAATIGPTTAPFGR